MSDGAYRFDSKPWTQSARKSERFTAYQAESPSVHVMLRRQPPGELLRTTIRYSDLIKRRTTDLKHNPHVHLSVSAISSLYFE